MDNNLSHSKRILLLINPKARSGEGTLQSVQTDLQNRGHVVILPQELGFPEAITRYAGEVDLVAIGGGDGSVNTCLKVLVETKLPLLLIPLGTANNLARTLGIPTDSLLASQVFEKGQIKKIDLGVANGLYFVNVLGFGMSSFINTSVPRRSKRIFGVFAFMFTAFKALKWMNPFSVTLDCDGTKINSRSWQITVCNGRHYGSGLVIEDSATLTDGTLFGVSLEVKKWWKAILLIPALFTGKYETKHELTNFSGKKIKIETKKPWGVDLDGDIRTKTPLEIHVESQVLSIYVGKVQ